MPRERADQHPRPLVRELAVIHADLDADTRAVLTIAPDGAWGAWLVDRHACGCDHCVREWHTGDAGPRSAPHEQTGPLPAAWAARVAGAGLARCGRPRADGAPCRAYVRGDGDACRHHRDRQPERGGA